MNFRTVLTAITLLTPLCATLPAFAKELPPNLQTGAGCEAYGVRPSSLVQVVADPVFNAHFVTTSEIGKFCPNQGDGLVWGCYRPDGNAYIVGKDWRVYWHEWCHAKLGPEHTEAFTRGHTYVAPTRTLASNN